MAYFDHNDELVIDQYDLYEYEEDHGMLWAEPDSDLLEPQKEA